MKSPRILGAMIFLFVVGFISARHAFSQSGSCDTGGCTCTVENTTSDNEVGNCYIIGYCNLACGNCNGSAEADCNCLDAAYCNTGTLSGGGGQGVNCRARMQNGAVACSETTWCCAPCN